MGFIKNNQSLIGEINVADGFELFGDGAYTPIPKPSVHNFHPYMQIVKFHYFFLLVFARSRISS